MKKINIAELLKDCPKGTELYSPIFGELKFNEVNAFNNRILVVQQNDYIAEFESDGRLINCKNGECLLFPSKDKRDWSKFQRPFMDGDVVVGENCACSYITIFRKFIDNTSFSHHVCLTSFGKFKVDDFSDIANLRLATEEEKEKLFRAIKTNGYKWNEETKTLEKLVEPKFKVGDEIKYKNGKNIDGVEQGVILSITDEVYDVAVTNNMGVYVSIAEQDDWELVSNKFDINTLKPFDKVLMRSSNAREWVGTFYSHYSNNKFYGCGMCCDQCVPYEENQHLLGTTNDCDEYFKNW